MPGGSDVEVHADAAEESESSEDVRLPGQFFKLEALVNDCQEQRKRGPERSEPAIGVFIPCKQGQQPGGRERMKEGGNTGEAFFRSSLARKEVQASGDERNGKDAQRDGAPEFLFEVVVVKVGAEQSAETDDVGLPGELLVTNPARGEREHDGENDPADGNPRRAEGFFENPDHQAGGHPGIGDASQAEMALVFRAHALGKPVSACNDGDCGESMHGNGVPGSRRKLVCGKRRKNC